MMLPNVRDELCFDTGLSDRIVWVCINSSKFVSVLYAISITLYAIYIIPIFDDDK